MDNSGDKIVSWKGKKTDEGSKTSELSVSENEDCKKEEDDLVPFEKIFKIGFLVQNIEYT